MTKLLRLLNNYFEPVLIIFAVSLMTLILCIQIIFRIFEHSIPWAEEFARYLFVWAMYLSISYCIKDDRHIRITFFIDQLNPKLKKCCLIISDFVFMFFSVSIAWFGFYLIKRSLDLGQIAPAMEIPVACLYASVFISSLLCIIRLSKSIYTKITLFNK